MSSIEKAGFEISCANKKVVIKKEKQTYAENNPVNCEYVGLAINGKKLWNHRFNHLNYSSLFKIKRFQLAQGLN